MRTIDLLLVFLITETQTQGINRLALNHALELADALRKPVSRLARKRRDRST